MILCQLHVVIVTLIEMGCQKVRFESFPEWLIIKTSVVEVVILEQEPKFDVGGNSQHFIGVGNALPRVIVGDVKLCLIALSNSNLDEL